MNIRIDIEQVRKVVNPETFFCYFGAVLIADSGDGQETHYAIKTITNKTTPKEFFVKKDGKWLPHANKEINAQLTDKPRLPILSLNVRLHRKISTMKR